MGAHFVILAIVNTELEWSRLEAEHNRCYILINRPSLWGKFTINPFLCERVRLLISSPRWLCERLDKLAECLWWCMRTWTEYHINWLIGRYISINFCLMIILFLKLRVLWAIEHGEYSLTFQLEVHKHMIANYLGSTSTSRQWSI